MATAGAQMLIPGVDPATAFFIPASYDRIRLFRPLAGPAFSHVRLRAEAGGDDLAVFDVTVADARGQVLVDVRGFTMIRVRDAATLARPVPVEPRAADAHEAGILPGEGMRVIDRLLASAVGPQVIVSPQPFAAVLAQARAAPPPKAARATERAGGDAEPMTATEATIAGLWEEMLGVDRVGPTDHFFDLGGHSLLAVQFVNKLRKRLGSVVAATALVQAPTVRQLAALVAPDDVDLSGEGAGVAVVPPPARMSGEEAVCIRAGGSATPLFLVHDGLGEILLYRTLATRIDASRAVYGLPPTIRADGSIVETGLVEMAAAHVAKLRRVQPQGPYLLAGLCAGGVIAVEMARQLEDAGQAVWYVGIVDAADVEARERPFFVTRARMKRFVRSLSAADTGAVDTGVIAQAAGRIGRFVSYEVGERARQIRTRRAVNRLRSIAREAVLVPATAPIAATPFLDVYKLAHREHRPAGVLIGASVVLYRATHGTGAPDDMPFFEQFADDALGWRRRVAQGVLVVPVSGGHVSALQEPHVAGLARAMQDGIDAAIARGGGDGGVTPVTVSRALDLQLVAP